MLSWKFRRKTAVAEIPSIGISIESAEATVAVFEPGEGGTTSVRAWESFAYDSSPDLHHRLSTFVQENGLEGESCRCVLPPEAYSLRLVERPAGVPEEELADATRWLIRDLVEFDVESAEIGILTLPQDTGRARTPRMFVVAARNDTLLDLASTIRSAGLRLLGFEIVETAMLGLDARLPETVAGGAVLRLDGKSSTLTLSQADTLYLARNLNLDLAGLDEAANYALTHEDPSGPEVIERLDELLLDIQRSLDYYESEYGLAPISRMSILPSAIDTSPLVPALSEALRPMQIESYDLSHGCGFSEALALDEQKSLSLAVGATLASKDLLGDSLLPSSFRPQEQGLGIRAALQTAALGLVALLLFYGFNYVQLNREKAELSVLESRHALLESTLEGIRIAAAAKAEELDPEAELSALSNAKNDRLSMLRDMIQRASRSDASFSNLLSGLARQDSEEIWLTRIVFSNGGDALEMEGRTLEPNRLPAYLRRLGTEQSFGDRRFRTFEIERPDPDLQFISFRIATLDEPDAGEGRTNE